MQQEGYRAGSVYPSVDPGVHAVPRSGRLYAFERVGGEWIFLQKLLASDGQDGDQFGHAIALDSDTLMVASLSDDDLGTDAGAVYVFERVADQWIQRAKLHASDGEAGDSFGYSIAVMDDTAVIGARREGNAGENWLGAAYVFERFGGVWSQSARLTASARSPLDNFGNSVSLGDGVIVVGAHQNDYAGSNAGSAYVYLRPAGGWEHATEDVRLIGDDTDLADNFGQYVCVDGARVICGANDADPAGAAYVFDLSDLLPCRTDLNADGVLDTRDFLEYLNLWTTGDPLADWNGDGTINTQDFIAYLNDWAAGC